MTLFDHPEFDHHENVVFCHDEAAGLKAIIAVHSTALGPAAGGCRMYPYASEADALNDVLRLSRGMSYKNSVAGLPLGGGKCVIIADPRHDDKPALLRAFSRHVQALAGRYWTAIDVGVGPEDADILAEGSDYIFASRSQFDAAGFPAGVSASTFTALGAFTSLRAGVAHVWRDRADAADLTGLRVAVQGLGGTGRELCRLLDAAGAELVVADIDEAAVAQVVDTYGATAVAPDAIHAADVDVFSPCALGAVVNAETIEDIRARLISGIANNQIAAPEHEHGRRLRERGIAYVPDFVANAGGMMAASTSIFSQLSMEQAETTVLTLFDTVTRILEEADRDGVTSAEVAERLAEERIAGERVAG